MLTLEEQIFKQIETAKNILLVLPSSDQTGDATAAALGLYLFLKKAGHEVDIAGPKNNHRGIELSFLPAYSQIQESLNNLRRFIVSVDITRAKVNQIKYTVENNQLNFIISPSEGWFEPEDVSSKAGEFKYSLIITVGVADLESLGAMYDQNIEFFYKTTIINIDQQSANESYGQINFVDLNSAAISETIFYLLKNYQADLISEDVATCLLAGIIAKTKNFKTTNLTPRTLLTSSELISLGGRREEIITHLYRSRDLKSLKLWGKILNNLKEESGGRLIWSSLRLSDITDSVATDDGLSDVIDELIANLPQAQIILILKEETPSSTKVVAYCLKNLNALELLKGYNPLGNSQSAKTDIPLDIDTTAIEIIAAVKAKLDKLNT